MNNEARNKIEDLLKNVLSQYDKRFKKPEYKTTGFYPILYFGNFKEYFESKKRIITVALNPSYKEFENIRRFPDIKSNRPEDYLDAYDGYFKREIGRDPYHWFEWYENVLNGIDCSYYSQKKYQYRALHTDICSPFATNPTWSALYKSDKDILMDNGIKTWHELVQILKPDIILCSFKKNLLKKIPFNFVESWNWRTPICSIKKERSIPFQVYNAKIGIDERISCIFWGTGGRKPFQVRDDDKEIGRSISKVLSR